jgi:hypothetical protein
MSPSPSHFEKSRFYRSKVRIANPDRRYYHGRGSGAQRPGYRPTCVLHATVTRRFASSSGPARKHTAKFEPAAWSWAPK